MLLGVCAAVARALLGAKTTSFFAGVRFLGDSVVLTEDISGSSSSSKSLQKALFLVGNLFRNGLIEMIGLAVQSTTLLE